MQCYVFAHRGYVRGLSIDGSGVEQRKALSQAVHLGSCRRRRYKTKREAQWAKVEASHIVFARIDTRTSEWLSTILKLTEGIQNRLNSTGMFRIGKRADTNTEWYPLCQAPHFPKRLPPCGMTSIGALIDASGTHPTSVCWVRLLLSSTPENTLIMAVRKNTLFSARWLL